MHGQTLRQLVVDPRSQSVMHRGRFIEIKVLPSEDRERRLVIFREWLRRMNIRVEHLLPGGRSLLVIIAEYLGAERTLRLGVDVQGPAVESSDAVDREREQ